MFLMFCGWVLFSFYFGVCVVRFLVVLFVLRVSPVVLLCALVFASVLFPMFMFCFDVCLTAHVLRVCFSLVCLYTGLFCCSLLVAYVVPSWFASLFCRACFAVLLAACCFVFVMIAFIARVYGCLLACLFV